MCRAQASAAENGYINSEWLQHIDNVVRWTAAANVKVVITFRNNNGTGTEHYPHRHFVSSVTLMMVPRPPLNGGTPPMAFSSR